MNYHIITYELACKKCKKYSLPRTTILKTKEEDTEFSREKLLEVMDYFSKSMCHNCDAVGNWICLKVYINDRDDIRTQLEVNIFKENTKLWGKPEGVLNLLDISFGIDIILDNIRMMKPEPYPSKPKGTAFIILDFLKVEPYSRISVFELDGITLKEVSDFLIASRKYWEN